MTGPEPSLKLPAKGQMPSCWRREVELLNDAARQLFNLKFEVQKLLCHFFPCRGTKKEQDCLVSVHLRLLCLSPHLSFGGRWEGMKSYNTTIWMLNHSLVELEKLCKISQENAVLWQGLLPPSCAGTDVSAQLGLLQPCGRKMLAFQPLHHAVCDLENWLNLLGSPLCFLWKLKLKTVTCPGPLSRCCEVEWDRSSGAGSPFWGALLLTLVLLGLPCILSSFLC